MQGSGQNPEGCEERLGPACPASALCARSVVRWRRSSTPAQARLDHMRSSHAYSGAAFAAGAHATVQPCLLAGAQVRPPCSCSCTGAAHCKHAHARAPPACPPPRNAVAQAEESSENSEEEASSLELLFGLSRTVGIRGNQVLAGSMFMQVRARGAGQTLQLRGCASSSV